MSKKDEREIKSLWLKYKRNNDSESRNQLLIHYSYLVKKVINRLGITYPNYVDIDDLISYGVFGLIDAIEKFDLSKGVKFETYASFRIRGAVIDQIRQYDWVPRNLRIKAKMIEDATERLEGSLGRSATEEELAQYISISIDELQKTLSELHSLYVVSLEDQILDNISVEDQGVSKRETPEEYVEAEEVKKILASAIDSLEERERTIVSLYYFDELTLKEIGMVLGVSESRVSQLHTRALVKLKNRLGRFQNLLL